MADDVDGFYNKNPINKIKMNDPLKHRFRNNTYIIKR